METPKFIIKEWTQAGCRKIAYKIIDESVVNAEGCTDTM